jgi:hypothetical protein
LSYLNTCNHCKKEWQSSHPGKFCSSNCNHLRKQTILRDNKDTNVICKNCNNAFVAQKLGVRFCSISCNNSHWFRNNKSKHNHKEAKRRAKKLNATPSWLSKQDWTKINELYDSCPNGFHVDHIVPLQGKEVSGLHVPWNLQYLSARENIIKGNRV